MITIKQWNKLCEDNGLVPFVSRFTSEKEHSYSIPKLANETRWAWIVRNIHSCCDEEITIYNDGFFRDSAGFIVANKSTHMFLETATVEQIDRELKLMMNNYKKFIKDERKKQIKEL